MPFPQSINDAQRRLEEITQKAENWQESDSSHTDEEFKEMAKAMQELAESQILTVKYLQEIQGR